MARFSNEKVTPTKARKWLKEYNYADNRPISQTWVNYLARQMKAGHWRSNGEPLIFDTDGKLLDGQHRLSALVLAGITLTFDVRRGIETDAFTTIDQGKSRTAGQVLGMMGVKSASLTAAVCRTIFNWECYGNPFRGDRVSPDEIKIVYDCYRSEIEPAVLIGRGVKGLPCRQSIAGFCFYLFDQVHKKKAAAFFETLRDGVASSAKDPALVLRNRLYAEAVANSRRSLPKRAELGLFIRAWNHYHKGDEITQLQIKPDGDGGFKIPAVRGLGRGQGGMKKKAKGSDAA